MTLSTGTRLGPYEILGSIGAGGMGEVYRARDTRLDRTVAVKILPAELSSDPERRKRLSREAKAISGLSHPNICTLYDVGHQDGTDFLVMEYLEGETLADRLEKGAMRTDEALRIAMDIAGALDRAHREGIVHRDLKPGNIMLTKSGAKLLDFGLAKAVAPAVNLSAMPTASKPLTAEGKIVGTFQYMSPEQVEGKEVDARSDIFSFGAVLYEMATGRRAFEGKTQASLAAAILERDPPAMSALVPMTPRALDRLVRTCLAKDPDNRWQSAHDLRQELSWIAEGGEALAAAVAPVRPARPREWAAWSVAAALVVVALILALMLLRATPPAVQVVRSSLLPPPENSFTPYNFAISPDGTRLAFVAVGPDGLNHLWVRVLSASGAQEISGSEDAIYPFWAPDSRRVGFFGEGKLRTVDTAIGSVKMLCDAPVGRGGTWNRDGTIVFAPSVASPLLRISDSGGEPVPLSAPLAPGSGHGYRWPYFLPDGKHYLYFSDWNMPGDPESNGVYIGSLDGGKPKLLTSELTGNVEFAAGRLLYVRDRSLMAQPFDPNRMEFTGPALPIVEEGVIKDTAGFHHAGFSVSQNGVVIIQSFAAFSTRLLWYDHAGKEIGQVPGMGYWDPRFSPDGRSLAVASDDVRNGKYYIHVIDLATGRSMRLTDGGREGTPVWSHDGKKIAFVSTEGNSTSIYEISADGSGSPRLLVKGAQKLVNDWSSDGHLVYMDFGKGLPFLGVYSDADQKAGEIGIGAEARFSPDGKWLARIEPRTRYQEIFVQPFAGSGARIQISQGGGAEAVWRHDGREIYYIGPDRRLIAVTFDPVTKTAGAPRALFQTHIVGPTFVLFQYDVAPDGRFLINSLSPDSPLTLITNWPAMISK